jgi:hypothetical protein
MSRMSLRVRKTRRHQEKERETLRQKQRRRSAIRDVLRSFGLWKPLWPQVCGQIQYLCRPLKGVDATIHLVGFCQWGGCNLRGEHV